MKHILHVDGDNFFAACLISKYPKYKGKPLVVGEERGMVTALSIEAKNIGIKRGDPIFQIKDKYKDLIILRGDYKLFSDISVRMHSIIESFTSNIEKYSIDESFADVTEIVEKAGLSPYKIGRDIKEKIQTSLGITVSLGISQTKTLAKIISTSSKPNGLLVSIDNDSINEILKNTPIEKVWGIGQKSAVKLRARGIYTAKDLKDIEVNKISMFGKPILDIKSELSGVMVHKLIKNHPLEHSMISSESFKATDDLHFIKSEFIRHIHHLSERLRKHKASARKVTFYIKDKNQLITSKSFSLLKYTDCTSVFLEEFSKNFIHICNNKDKIRTTGVIFEDIILSEKTNLSLFDKLSEKEIIVFREIDKINNKKNKIFIASLLINKKNHT